MTKNFEDLEVEYKDNYYVLTGEVIRTGTEETYQDPAEWEYDVVYEETEYQYCNGEPISIKDIPYDVDNLIIGQMEWY